MNDDTLLLSLPCAEALLAGTIAAMTAWADPCPRCPLGPDDQRRLLARKLVSNLCLLAQHPSVGPELRQVMAMAHRRWVEMGAGQPPQDRPTPVETAAGPAGGMPRTWH